jgi:uncharacterized membrane protein YbhN (UPF0104 family)
VKQAALRLLKVGLPLAIGIWLVLYFYRALDPAQREELFAAFGQADLRWMALAILVGWLSHVSRAWRWRYILRPLGHRPGFWNCYHARDGRVLSQPLPPQGRRGQPCDLPVPHGKGAL